MAKKTKEQIERDEQIYQILDYIEFLESKYARELEREASGLQKFAENLEDKLRKKAVSPNTIREAFQLISAADRVLSGVSSAGKQILSDLGSALDAVPDAGSDAESNSRTDPEDNGASDESNDTTTGTGDAESRP